MCGGLMGRRAGVRGTDGAEGRCAGDGATEQRCECPALAPFPRLARAIGSADRPCCFAGEERQSGVPACLLLWNSVRSTRAGCYLPRPRQPMDAGICADACDSAGCDLG